jgi:hypothetical protein
MVKEKQHLQSSFSDLGNPRLYLSSVSSKGCGFMFREVRLSFERFGFESCILTIERPLRVIQSWLYSKHAHFLGQCYG